MKRYNKYASGCADEADLKAFRLGELDEDSRLDLVEHVAICDRCAFAIDWVSDGDTLGDADDADWPASLTPTKVVKDIAAAFQKQVAAEDRLEIRNLDAVGISGLTAGQIWRTKVHDIAIPTANGDCVSSIFEMGSTPHLVVLANPFVENIYIEDGQRAFRVVEVIPVTDNVEFAAKGDHVLSEEHSPLGYAVMLELWNRQPMIVDNLDSCLASIEDQSLIENQILQEAAPQSEGDDYSWFGLLKKGEYGDEKMRFRAREYESTAYLRDPVLELRSSLAPALGADIRENSIVTNWRARVAGLLTVSIPSWQHAAASDVKRPLMVERAYFGGELLLRSRTVTENEREITLSAADPIFENKLVIVGTPSEPLLIALLSRDELDEGTFTATIGLQSDEDVLIDDSSDDSIYSAESLSKTFGNLVDASLVTDSISAVSASGLRAWSGLAETLPSDNPLRQTILDHPRVV